MCIEQTIPSYYFSLACTCIEMCPELLLNIDYRPIMIIWNCEVSLHRWIIMSRLYVIYVGVYPDLQFGVERVSKQLLELGPDVQQVDLRATHQYPGQNGLGGSRSLDHTTNIRKTNKQTNKKTRFSTGRKTAAKCHLLTPAVSGVAQQSAHFVKAAVKQRLNIPFHTTAAQCGGVARLQT